MARKPGIVKSFQDIALPQDERGSSVTPNKSSFSKFKTRKIGRSESGHSIVVRSRGQLEAQRKAAASGKAAKASLKKQQVRFPGTEGRNIRQETLDRGKGKFDPGKPPAKSIAQTRNANIVNKIFGGTRSISKGGGGGGTRSISKGGGGGGPPGTPRLSQGTFSAFKRR